ncbi:hypothetical protein [Mucilaginibacter sp. PAMB04168]|uniref:hypothetical protein n=1 Tax=Mucilaginibacter sp. PAMB04168 TaxID=3138567 RepID=UPI0031F61130
MKPYPVIPNKVKFLFFLFLSTCVQVYAQSVNSEQDIAAIRQQYQTINSLKLNTQRFTYESSGCVDGGVITYFLKKKEIVRITESGSIGDGSWVNEYYYSAGKTIFCLETIVGGPAIGKVTKTQYRYYIKNSRPIRVMKGQKIIPAGSKATEILRTASKIYKAYTTKDFVSALCNP